MKATTTPNGRWDGVYTTTAHEIEEVLTDPLLDAYVGPNVTENADLCNWQKGTTFTTSGGASANNVLYSNLDGIGFERKAYMIQENWVNAAGGYGANVYGLPFWGRDYGFSGSGFDDWASSNYKAQCASGLALTGVSADPSEGHLHGALCGLPGTGDPKFYQRTNSTGCTPRAFNGGDNMGTADPEWDFGYYKAECAANEYAAGVSQSTSGSVNGLLCCPAAVRHRACTITNAEVFYGQDSASYRSPDWDSGFYKGQCPAGQYVAGISRVPPSQSGQVNGAAHALLCCSP